MRRIHLFDSRPFPFCLMSTSLFHRFLAPDSTELLPRALRHASSSPLEKKNEREGWGSEDGRAIGNLMGITKPLDKILQTQKQTFTDKQLNMDSNCRPASDSLTGIALQHSLHILSFCLPLLLRCWPKGGMSSYLMCCLKPPHTPSRPTTCCINRFISI